MIRPTRKPKQNTNQDQLFDPTWPPELRRGAGVNTHQLLACSRNHRVTAKGPFLSSCSRIRLISWGREGKEMNRRQAVQELLQQMTEVHRQMSLRDGTEPLGSLSRVIQT